MTITATTVPTYPVPGQDVKTTFSGGTTGNVIRLRCIGAPRTSKLGAELASLRETATDEPSAPVVDVPVGTVWGYTFDQPGTYTFRAQEFTTLTASYGGGYAGSTDAFQERTKVGTEDDIIIHVSQRMTARLTSRLGDAATLVLYVNNATIRATTPKTHGIDVGFTPRIDEPARRGALAIDGGNMPTKLAALVGETVANAFDVGALALELSDDLPAHFVLTTSSTHANADNDNGGTLTVLPTAAGEFADPVTLSETGRRLIQAYSNHVRNLDDNGAAASSAYHASATYDDLPIAAIPAEGDAVMAHLAIADVYRLYTLHIANTTAHGAADVTNTIAATVPEFTDVCLEFLRLVRGDPTATAAGDQSGAVSLERNGFTRGN